jgi:hypothetical protein
MQRHAARRWLAATGIATALVVSSAVSAAAEPVPTLGVVLPDTLFAPGSPGTLAEATVLVSEPTTLHNLTIKYDFSDIADFADVAAEPGLCETAGTVVTCLFEEEMLDGWGGTYPGLAVSPKSGKAAGEEGELKVTVTADGLAAVSDTATVSIGEGVDLAAEAAPDLSAAPGGSYEEKLGVQNVGSVTAHGAVLALNGDLGILAGSPRYSNCTYQGDEPRVCVFDTDLAVGKSYGLTYPFKLRADTPAPGGQFIEFGWMTPAEWDAQKKALQKLGLGEVVGVPGSGPALALTEKARGELEPVEGDLFKISKQVDEAPWNNWTESAIKVTGNNPADAAAVGDRASGAAGTEVEVEVGVKNNGPASILPSRSGEGFGTVIFTVPPDSTVTDAADDCIASVGGEWDYDHPGRAGGTKYHCFPGLELPVGEKTTWAFKLRIDTATPDAKGKVELQSPFDPGEPLPPIYDSTPSNNVADVVLNGTATEEPSTPANPSPGGDDNGGLPVTGTPVAIVAGVGLLLAVAGFVLFRLARRRRLTEV